MSMTRALIIRTLLLTAMLVLPSGHTHAGCDDTGYTAILDYKTGMVVDDLASLSQSGEQGRFTCKATADMWFSVYLDGELYNAGCLWDFIDWSVNGEHCFIPNPFKQKEVVVQYSNLQTERTVTVIMNAKPYFYEVGISHVSERGTPAASFRLVRYYYAIMMGVIRGFVWFVGAVSFVITLMVIGKVFLMILPAVV